MLFNISGAVVSSNYFLASFGLINSDGSTNTSKSNAVSSNVVSVLQAGAFFGALGSSPISGWLHSMHRPSCLTLTLYIPQRRLGGD